MKYLRRDSKPFSLHHDDHAVERHRGWREMIRMGSDKLHELFITFIPLSDAREYPPRFMYATGIIVFLLIGLFFGALFGFLFYTNKRNVYLAPANSGPDFFGASCEEIQSTNTGVYLGSKGGLWEGSTGFEYSEASYIMTVSNWKLSQQSYKTSMTQLYQAMSQLGRQAVNLDLAQNLLLWFSFIGLPDFKNAANRFTLIGDPAIAFNRQNVFGTVSSVAGDCKLANQYATYDKTSGSLILNIPYDEFVGNPICLASGNPVYLGYNPFTSVNNFQVKVDVYSLVTALAINLDIIPFKVLIEIKAFRRNSTTAYGEITTSRYYNPKFPGMTPIPCIVGEYCFIRLGPSNFAIPFFHHLGNSTSKAEKCSCKEMTRKESKNPFHNCNRFAFIVGFMYFPSNDIVSLGEFFRSVSASDAHNAMYEPSYVASAVGAKSPLYEQFNQADYRNKMYSFCSMPHGNCSMVTFTLIDSDNPDWSISKFYYQLLTGACQDQITPAASNWQALIDTPFTSLTQDYNECTDNTIYVFFTQLGSTLGTMDILVPLAIILTIISMNIYQKITNDRIPDSYSREEKDRALDALAISLLLTRDVQMKEGADSLTERKVDEKRNHEILSEIVKALHLDSELHSDDANLQRVREEVFGSKSSIEIVKLRSDDNILEC